ncbi:hypothetical protein [Mucilaginibacter paludis]|uniref:Lipocalin-like domain-containing protein n=1 Tax=Mucilaginibacter paludis DSM 18603 TaxID=714943 RepID=H1XZ31_9SPHI|nr:hypothetical protein [Mucilaginibacter paludis]EHQ24616.1 hypothetical protein Mucpa_0422 [Mucilaginibacter paludis DSM 18603]
MKNKLLGLRTLLSSFLLLISMESVAQDIKINLSGNWKVNYEQSYFGDAPTYTAYKALQIIQKTDLITFSKTDVVDANTDTIVNERLPLNGNIFQYVDANGRTRKLSAKPSEDGKTLIVNTTASQTGDPAKEQFRGNERYSLDESGKVLIVKRTVKDNTGFEYYIKVFYDKQ